ncbi:MAG: DMT family transporter [Rothia sp. (in: high G+C Gram-positive bacteria)]|nr:DMT family transporter [Rothia sp. (in: high G+C Gram-positive bacteria)]
MTHTASSRTTYAGVALVLGSAVSLQFGAAFAYQLFPHLGSWGVTTLRLAVAALVLTAFTRPKVLSWSGAQWRAAALFGASMALMNGTFYAAIERIPIGLAVTIEFLGPLVLAAVLSRRGIDFLWLGIAVVGMGVLGYESLHRAADYDPLGVVFALIAGLGWALYVLSSAKVGQAVPGTGGLAVAMVFATLFLLPLGAPGALKGVTDPHLLALALGTGLLASLVPYTLELMALRRLPRNTFSILLSLEPAVAAVAGFLLLGQVTGPIRWVAITLLILASVGVTLSARKNPGPQQVELGEAAPITASIPLVDDSLRSKKPGGKG